MSATPTRTDLNAAVSVLTSVDIKAAQAAVAVSNAEKVMSNAGGKASLSNALADIAAVRKSASAVTAQVQAALATLPPVTPTPTLPQPIGPGGSWAVAFEDTFQGTTLDATKWVDHDGWKNQNNVTDNAANVKVNNGLELVLASSGSGAALQAASYLLPVGGFAEAQIDFQGNVEDPFNWPAWWCSGPGWPAAGEADIFEGLGAVTTNYHSPQGQEGPYTIAGNWVNGYHVYGYYRGPTSLDIYFDGAKVKSWTPHDNGAGQSPILTMGQANEVEYGEASAMHVKYVRCWVPA